MRGGFQTWHCTGLPNSLKLDYLHSNIFILCFDFGYNMALSLVTLTMKFPLQCRNWISFLSCHFLAGIWCRTMNRTKLLWQIKINKMEKIDWHASVYLQDLFESNLSLWLVWITAPIIIPVKCVPVSKKGEKPHYLFCHSW